MCIDYSRKFNTMVRTKKIKQPDTPKETPKPEVKLEDKK